MVSYADDDELATSTVPPLQGVALEYKSSLDSLMSYFHGADLLVAADCAGFAHGNFHNDFIKDRKMVIACPKLDQGQDIYVQKLVSLIDDSKVNTITVTIRGNSKAR